ncbi:MAG: hypothetical protein A6F72_07540 [Cycloclasticus sp. symbiont of Poecilosclerida sp. N]|nr:MAG: hypothetical protein A6F72_07540 [Cycloclasticus sp. symbiont of Poecilosclerida sp. N]
MQFDMNVVEHIENQISSPVVDKADSKSHNYFNITATLRILWGVAQPWRFFFACNKCRGVYYA